MRRTVLLAAATLVGCGDIIGLDGYTEGDGSVMGDVTVDTGGGDARPDVKVGDAGNDVVVTPCNGGVCMPALPSGWSWAVYSPDSRPACATGYGTPKDIEEGLDAGAATCGCSCTTTNPTCDPATLSVNAGTGGSCNTIVSGQVDVGDGGCNALSSNITTPNMGGQQMSASTTTTPTGGSCAGALDASVPPVAVIHQGRTCGFSGSVDAGGCTGGDLCMPNPAPFSACVSQAGNVACPAGFPNQHFTGTMVDDTRGCASCGCTFDAGTCGGNVTFYQNGTCSFGATGAIPLTNTCTGVAKNATYRSFIYAATTNPSCTPGTSSPDGGVTFGDLTTVCCQ